MTEVLTHWKKEAGKEYLGSWDLILGADNEDKPVYKELILTISEIKKQLVPDMKAIREGRDEKKEELLVYFEEISKPMIIHAKANFKGIEAATGTPFIERWLGKKICVYVENVKAFGTKTDALRIKSVPRRNCDVCGKEIDEATYRGSLNKYGMALCSAACKEKAGK